MIIAKKIRFNQKTLFVVKVFLLSFCIFFITTNILLPPLNSTKRTVEIEATGLKNPLSNGEGVRLLNMSANGIDKSPVDIFLSSRWQEGSSGTLTWNPHIQANNNIVEEIEFRTLNLTFFTDSWSGLANIYVDGKLMTNIDLYSESMGSKEVKLFGDRNYSTARYLIFNGIYFIGILMASGIILMKVRKYAYEKDKQIYFNALLFSLVVDLVCLLNDNRFKFNFHYLLSMVCITYIYLVIFKELLYPLYKRVTKSKDMALRLCVSLLVYIFIMTPLFTTVNENKYIYEHVVNDDGDFQEIILSEGVKVEQNINIQGNYKKLNIKVRSEDTSENKFKLTVQQGEGEFTKEYSAKDFNLDDSIQVDEEFLSSGMMKLTLEGLSGHSGDSIRILTANDEVFGSFKNGERYSRRNLAISLEVEELSRLYKIQLIFFVLLVGVLAYLLMYIWKKDYKDMVVFTLTFLSISLYQMVLKPNMYVDAQPFHETGSNFFQQTYERGFFASLLLDDFYYLPLANRLISDFVIFVLKQVKNAFLHMNLIGLVIRAGIISLVNIKVFNIKVEKFGRLVIALVLGAASIFIGDDSLFFHNLGYWYVFLILLLLSIQWEKLNKAQYTLLLASTIMLLSKIYFILLLPIYTVILVFMILTGRTKENKRSIVYLCISLGVIITELLYFAVNIMNSGLGGEYSFIDRAILALKSGTYYYMQIVYAVLLKPFLGRGENAFFINLSLLLGFFLLLALLVRNIIMNFNKKNHTRVLGTILFLLAFSYIVALFTRFLEPDSNVDISTVQDIYIQRREIFVVVPLVYGELLAVWHLIKSMQVKKWKNIVMFGASLALCIQFFTGNIVVNETKTGLYDWSNHYNELKRDAYAIPIYGDNFILKNAYVGYVGADIDRFKGEYNYVYSAKDIKNYDTDSPIYSVDLSDAAGVALKEILEVYVKKTNVLQDINSYAIIKDIAGKEITRVQGVNTLGKEGVAYFLPGKIENIGSIEFQYSRDGSPYPIKSSVYLGIKGKYVEQ